MEDFKNRMEDNLPYFLTNAILDFVHCIYSKITYRCRVGINNIVTVVYSTSLSTRIICRQIAVLWLFILCKQCTYCIIVSTLQFAALSYS